MKALLAILAILLSACANLPSAVERRELADTLAARQNWRATSIAAGLFRLAVYMPVDQPPAARLAVYIEGDGFAWIGPGRASSDPTPRDPLALRLALVHPDGNAAYIARPCQYADAQASHCSSTYWTDKRFAPEVIDAFDRAIEELKRRFGAQHLTLVGYSGGGAVAALVAARRTDVDKLVTVAGNLDHRAWTSLHGIEPLTGSLNPADVTIALHAVRQWHFVGSQDRVVPPSLLQSFAERFPAERRPVILIEPGYDHRCCWAENWPWLWKKTTGRELGPDAASARSPRSTGRRGERKKEEEGGEHE